MSLHSYSRCWLHLTWATLNRQRLLAKPEAAKVSRFLHEYAESKGIYMKINYVNPDHTHALIDLPTSYSIEEVMKLFKGASSHWINANRIISSKFAWGAGTERFQFRIPTCRQWQATSPIRKPITEGNRLLKRSRLSYEFTALNGEMTDGMSRTSGKEHSDLKLF